MTRDTSDPYGMFWAQDQAAKEQPWVIKEPVRFTDTRPADAPNVSPGTFTRPAPGQPAPGAMPLGPDSAWCAPRRCSSPRPTRASRRS